MTKILNTRGYEPIDDAAATGYRRPPRDAACICDYFAQLMGIEDNGKFLHSEMQAMIDKPSLFFDGGRKSPSARVIRDERDGERPSSTPNQ